MWLIFKREGTKTLKETTETQRYGATQKNI
jgi:hypothetical protein